MPPPAGPGKYYTLGMLLCQFWVLSVRLRKVQALVRGLIRSLQAESSRFGVGEVLRFWSFGDGFNRELCGLEQFGEQFDSVLQVEHWCVCRCSVSPACSRQNRSLSDPESRHFQNPETQPILRSKRRQHRALLGFDCRESQCVAMSRIMSVMGPILYPSFEGSFRTGSGKCMKHATTPLASLDDFRSRKLQALTHPNPRPPQRALNRPLP